MPTLDITPFLSILCLMGASVLIVYGAASLYYRFKQQKFTLPEGVEVSFLADTDAIHDDGPEPEGDPATEPTTQQKVIEVKSQAEMLDLLQQRIANVEKRKKLDYDKIPTGQVFIDTDGKKYKFVAHPWEDRRIKMVVTGAVTNPNAIPMPSTADMPRITKRQAIEHLDTYSNPLEKGDSIVNIDETERCEICLVQGVSHSHAGSVVRAHAHELAKRLFKKWLDDMDLSQLDVDDVRALWARCKHSLEWNAGAEEMKEMEKLWRRAGKLAQQDWEDEQFFENAKKRPYDGPVEIGCAPQVERNMGAVMDSAPAVSPRCNFQPEDHSFQPCTRAAGHDGPCAHKTHVEAIQELVAALENADPEMLKAAGERSRATEKATEVESEYTPCSWETDRNCLDDSHSHLEQFPDPQTARFEGEDLFTVGERTKTVDELPTDSYKAKAAATLIGEAAGLHDYVKEYGLQEPVSGCRHDRPKKDEPAPTVEALAAEYKQLPAADLTSHAEAILKALNAGREGVPQNLADKFMAVKDLDGSEYIRDPFWFQWQQMKMQMAHEEAQKQQSVPTFKVVDGKVVTTDGSDIPPELADIVKTMNANYEKGVETAADYKLEAAPVVETYEQILERVEKKAKPRKKPLLKKLAAKKRKK